MDSQPDPAVSILVVEDEDLLLKSMASVLEREGYRVLTENRGRPGVESFRRNLPDLLLLDDLMPDMSGMQVLDEVKKIEPEAVVVMIAGFATVELAVAAIHAGAWEYVPKPFTANDLREFVGRAARGVRARASRLVLPPPPVVAIETWAEIAKAIATDSRRLHSLDWRRFEDLIGRLLESFGWSITPMGYTKDDGVDLIAARVLDPGIDIRMMVQCKRYAPSRKIGVEVVREIWAVKWEKGFHQAMIATTSSFTQGARAKARKWNLELKDHAAILEWCRQHGRTP